MEKAKSIILGLVTLFTFSTVYADEFSNQKMMCVFDGKEILITAPMPANWTYAQREEACQGAEQAFANGTLVAGGTVQIHLPWPSFEAQ